MGCAVSTPSGARQSAGPLSKQASCQSLGGSSAGEPQGASHPSPFLQYYTIASLRGKEVFGPFLKLHSYDPESGNLNLSVLVVCTEAAQRAGQLRISWWESPSLDSGGPLSPGKEAAAAGTVAEDGTQGEVGGSNRSKASQGERETGRAASDGRGGRTGNTVGPGGVGPDGGSGAGCSTGSGGRPGTEGNGGPGGSSGMGCSSEGVGKGGGGRGKHSSEPERKQQQQARPDVPADAAAGSGELLFSWRNWRFWRFRIGAKCGKAPKLLLYQVGLLPGSLHTVAVPALEEPWRMAFYSCNGLDASHDHAFSGGEAESPALALWKDVARRHAVQPFHLMVGGGDQLYNDCVFEGPLLRGWDRSQDDKDTAAKAAIPFSDDIANEVEEFYFSHYVAHWSQPAYAGMFASVPMFSTWDDHDIVDGWGSYDHVINDSEIMQGLFSKSRLFYLLFQHHTTLERLSADGYWCEPACCALHRLGPSVALLAPDTRTCRTQHRVLPPDFLEQAQERLRALPPCVRHVVVLLGGPIVYPRLPVQDALQKLDDIFTGDTLVSVIMQKTGLAAKVTKRFGMVAYLDDIIDQWSSNQHTGERDQLLEAVMALAEEKGFRVTLLSGDVHCAGYGMLHSRGDVKESEVPLMRVPSEAARSADPRFIPQIISSAIVNVPPPSPLMKLLCRAGRCPEPILKDCVHRMMPLFGPECDMNSLLLAKRNWCEATLGGPGDELSFSLRCERDLGDGVDVYSVTVPPLQRPGELSAAD